MPMKYVCEEKKKNASGLKSHRISAYRFLPIAKGWTVVRSRRMGKKEGGKKGKGYK